MASTKNGKEIVTYTDSNGNIVASLTRTVGADDERNLSDTIAGGAANQLIAFSMPKARCQEFVFKSDQIVSLKTNSSSAPQETITLTPDTVSGSPGVYSWNVKHSEANPILGDVSQVFVSNPGTVAANVTLYLLQNSTP